MKLERFELDREGVGSLLNSKSVSDLTAKYGEAVRQRCAQGSVPADDYEVTTKKLGDRAGTIIRPSTVKAYYSNLKHNTLLTALGQVKK